MNNQAFLSPPQTLADIEAFAYSFVEEINDGREDALNVFVAAKKWQRTIEAILSQIESQVLDEATKYGSKRFSYKGVTLETRELGSRWFYDKCNDPIMNKYIAEKASLSEAEKQRQAFLKALTSATHIMDEETGELVRVIPPRKESKTGVVATLS
jgi:hypothetical protein